MGFTKTNKAEESEVLSPTQHQAVSDELHKVGKTSLQQATPEERESVVKKVDSTE